MDKKEMFTTDQQFIEDVFAKSEVGYLGVLTADGYPRVVPVNFATVGNIVYFHGATKGEKFEAMKANAKVTFNVTIPFSTIPSYWLSGSQTCSASAFYKSVQINGRVAIIEDVQEKADALNLLMDKLQPEGKYTRLTPDEPMYHKALAETGIFRIDPDQVTAKAKFGQNRPEKVRQQLIELLKQRGTPIDLATATILRQMLSVD